MQINEKHLRRDFLKRSAGVALGLAGAPAIASSQNAGEKLRVGFIGVVIMVQPTGAGYGVAAGVALFAALLVTIVRLMVKRLTASSVRNPPTPTER